MSACWDSLPVHSSENSYQPRQVVEVTSYVKYWDAFDGNICYKTIKEAYWAPANKQKNLINTGYTTEL